MHGLKVASDRLGDEWPCAIDPGGDPGRPPARYVAAEPGRHFDGAVDVPSREPLLQISVIGERRLFDEISRTA